MEEIAVEPGMTGVYTHADGPTGKDIPVWFHCSSHFVVEAPELDKVYARVAPPPPPSSGVERSSEFPVRGTPFMDDNADSDNEGGMGAAELVMNGANAADVDPASVQLAQSEEDEEEEEEEESKLEELKELLGDEKLAEVVHEQVDSEVLAEAFTHGSGAESGSNPLIAKNKAHAKAMQRTHSHVVIVMHGCLRNAAQYLEVWKPIANRCGLLVLCPQFSAVDFPEYNTGNMFDRATGRAVPKDQWLFSVIERMFDGLRTMKIHRSHYHIYGHSAGAQFVHRMMMFMPEARINVGISANAGWYTLPSHDAPFPYGLHCSGIDRDSMKTMLSRRLVVLLGQEDNKTLHLRRTRRALAQGVTRFDRGITFFLQAKSMAQDLGIPLQWSLRTVEGVGHVHEAMSIAASTSFGFVPHPRTKRTAVAS